MPCSWESLSSRTPLLSLRRPEPKALQKFLGVGTRRRPSGESGVTPSAPQVLASPREPPAQLVTGG